MSGSLPHEPILATASRASLATAVGLAARIALQLVGLIVLARLLSPRDYGLFAMVMVVVTIGEVLRDFGLSTAAVRAPTLTRAQQSNLLWVNTGIGVGLGLVAVAASSPVSSLFGEPALAALTSAVAITFVLNGAAAQLRAGLNRSLRITALVVTDVASQALGVIAGITAALLGAEYWSLAVMTIVGSGSGLAILAVQSDWLPGRYRRGVPLGEFWTFGRSMVGATLVGYTARTADSFIIGVSLGASSLGLYSRAQQILTMPQQIQAPATRVILPILARVQDRRELLASRVLKAQRLLLHATGAAVALPAAVAPPLFAVVLGEQWVDAATVYCLLAPGVFAAMGNYPMYWLFLAKGLTGSWLRYSLVARPLTVLALLVGSTGGLYGIAAAYSISHLLLWPLSYWWAARASGLDVRAIWRHAVSVTAVYVVAASCGAAAALWALPTVSDAGQVVQITTGVTTALAVVGLLLWVSPLREDVLLARTVTSHLRRPRGTERKSDR